MARILEGYCRTVAVTSAQITAFLMLNMIGSLKLKVQCRTTIPIFAEYHRDQTLGLTAIVFVDASNYRNREVQHSCGRYEEMVRKV